MISYNIAESSIECHSFLAGGGGTGREFPKELLNGNNTKWYAVEKCEEGPLGWVHIKFTKPLFLNGFGITSANDCQHRDMKNFRLYGKIHHKDESPVQGLAQPKLNTQMEKTLLKDFEILKTVENEVFANRHETKKYGFDDGQ